MAKRIVVIHGRSRKPSKKNKHALVVDAIQHGLGRVGGSLGTTPVDLAYYGHINNVILDNPGHAVTKEFLDSTPVVYQKPKPYWDQLKDLYKVSNAQQTSKKQYRLFKRRYGSQMKDDLASAFSPLLNLLGVADNIIDKQCPDLMAYFKYREVGSRVRAQVHRILKKALRSGDEICVVAHSMGSIVAYDTLWKMSRMSEYKDYRDLKVDLLVTLGSPLGEGAVKNRLYDANEPDDGRYPTNIVHWQNFAAYDDFVAHDEDIADDFKKMKRKKLVRTLKDHRIFNYYVGGNDLNTHKLYGYLDNVKVARTIWNWLQA